MPKTHRITLPQWQHVAALAGATAVLLPLNAGAKKRLSEAGGTVLEAAAYHTGAPERGLAWYWKRNGTWNSTGSFHQPYAPGDLLMCREPWDTAESGYEYELDNTYEINDGPPWQPASRMPAAACRLWLRVVRPEALRVADVAEELRAGWEAAGGSREDWAWLAEVKREERG